MLPALGSAPMLEKWPGIGKGGRAWTRCDDRYGTGKFGDDPDQCFVCGYYRYRHCFVEIVPPAGEKPKEPWQQYREKHKMYRDHAMEVTENDFKDVIREMTAHFDGLTHTKIAEEWRGYEDLIPLLLRHFNVAPGVVIEDGVESEDEVSLPANFSEWLKQPTDHLG